MDNTINILDWKKKHGSIYLIEIEGEDHYFRPLTVQEYTIFTEWPQSLGSISREEAIINSTHLHPRRIPLDADDIRRTDLAFKIVFMSMPTSDEGYKKRIDDIRERLSVNPHKLLVINICREYPTFSPLDLLDLSLEKLIEIAVIVEKAVGKVIIGSKKGHQQKMMAVPDPKEFMNRPKKMMFNPNQLALSKVGNAETALADEMEKYTGKRPKKAGENESQLSELHKQMRNFRSS